jgi:hypothetical protein
MQMYMHTAYLLLVLFGCLYCTHAQASENVYLSNGTYIAAASSYGEDCKIQCDVGAHMTNETRSVSQTYASFILETYGNTPQIQDAIASLEGYEESLLAQSFTQSWTTQHCKMCRDVLDPESEVVDKAYYTMDDNCYPICDNSKGYYNRDFWAHAHPARCVQCTLSECDLGQYKTGDNCTKCEACERPITENWEFTSHGTVLDDIKSCAGKCNEGYFEDIIFNVSSTIPQKICVPHQEVECTATEFQVNGTHITDAYCEACGECEGMNETQTCSAYENAICEPCIPQELERGAFYQDNNCTRGCLPGYIEDKEQQICEECAYTCPAGQTFTQNRRNCTDCERCNNTLPDKAAYLQECAWQCHPGFALDNSECKEIANLIPILPSTTSYVQCELGQQLDCYPELQLCNCTDCTQIKSILTPPGNTFNVSWQWLPTRSECEWECLPSYYYLPINDAAVDCVSWQSLQVQAHLTSIDVNDINNIVLARPKREHKIPFSELMLFMGTVTATITIFMCLQ